MNNNNEIMRRIWVLAKQYGLSLISSNGGTGKTTYFLFRCLREALYNQNHLHIYVRYANQMETMAERVLKVQPTYSKRQRKLLDKLEIVKDGDKFIYLAEKRTGRKIAQILNVFGQAFYKPYGNMIGAKYAIFDEILAENGEYCPDELNKFNRLVFTMARSNEYHVIGLYNNTSPNFDYFRYYGGKTYNTHVAESGALFVYFHAAQYAADARNSDPKSIQAIIQRTEYNAVYNNNQFTQYPALCRPAELRGASKFFRLLIESRLFWIREHDGYLYLDRAKDKPTNKRTYTINSTDRSTLPQLPNTFRQAIVMYSQESRLKTTNINDTIFVKILEKYC